MREVDKARAVREARANAVSRAASGHAAAHPAIGRFIVADERRREDELARERRAREDRVERAAREERERREYLETQLNPRGDRR